MEFYCNKCKIKFESEGYKVKWQDPIYGMNWKYAAKCPGCNEECDRAQSNIVKSTGSSTSSSCPTGTCPFA